jgi:guanylate cyclase
MIFPGMMRRVRIVSNAVLAGLAAVGSDPRDDEQTRQGKVLLVLTSVLILPIAVVWGSLYLIFGSPVGYVPLAYALLLLGAIIAFARTRNFALLLYVSVVDILVAPTLSMIPLGGFLPSGGVGLWGILAPVGALVFRGPRAGLRWFFAYLAVFISSGVAGQLVGPVSTLPEWFTSTMLGLNIVLGGSFVFFLIATFLRQRDHAMDALAREQERSERLLLNVLPKEIAARLKAGESPIADAYEHATVLYADIVGSTMLAERLDAKQLVALLNGIFSRFDLLAERHGVEKIRTIGDNYMCVAGVPRRRADHAQVMARMALGICAYLDELRAAGEDRIDFRIGMNSGPCVGGVIGLRKFVFDIWGDSVNTASRMESHGEPGRIHLSDATYELIRDEFDCEPRGTIEVKGKGPMRTWFLLGERRAHAESARPSVAAASAP